jgi:hypothetical protein
MSDDNFFKDAHKADTKLAGPSAVKAPAASPPSSNFFSAAHTKDTGAASAPKVTPAAGGGGFMDKMRTITNLPMAALKTFAPGAHAAITGARHGASFGLSDKFDAAVQGRPEATIAVENQQVMKQHPIAYGVGKAVGSVAPAVGVSGAIGKAVPWLAKTAFVPSIANQAATGAVLSAGEDAAKGELPDWKKAAVTAGIGGAAGGGLNFAGRALLPAFRIGTAASELSGPDISAARVASDKAKSLGVKLTLPEAVKAGGAKNASAVEGLYNTSTNSPAGSRLRSDFVGARKPTISSAARKVAGEIGSGQPGYKTKQAAEGAIENARGLVNRASRPFYKRSEGTIVPNVPNTPAIALAKKSVMNDPVIMGELQGAPQNSIKFLDVVKKAMDRNKTVAENVVAGRGYNPQKASVIGRDTKALTGATDAASPDYAAARRIKTKGMGRLVEPLEGGALGDISRTPSTTAQAQSLFGVTNPVEQASALAAAKRLPQGVPQGLLGARLSSMASTEPLSIGTKFLPTDEARAVATKVAGDKMAKINDLIDTFKAINQKASEPHVGQYTHNTPIHGPVAEAWHTVRNLGSGGVVKRMHNENAANTLMRILAAQRAAQSLGGAAADRSIDQFAPSIRNRPNKYNTPVGSW